MTRGGEESSPRIGERRVEVACEGVGVAELIKHLLVGSIEAYSGKSAIILGLAQQLKEQGLAIAYGKPLATSANCAVDPVDEDVRFIAQTLQLPEDRLRPTLLMLNPEMVRQRLQGNDQNNYAQSLKQYHQLEGGDLVILEGPGFLEEGSLFDLSLLQIAQAVNASILLTALFHPTSLVDSLLSAKERLGDRLLGVLINDIPADQISLIDTTIKPFLEAQSIPIFAMLPSNRLLRSVSVRELVRQLNAEVLCRSDRLDLLVEKLTIGAMSVSSALKYFRNTQNMAVVTGGDRTDIQLAALETATQCLILTGHIPPSPSILTRAEDLEIPILSVDLDTLTAVEIIERTFGQVRLQEAVKVDCIQQMMAKHFDIERLMSQLNLKPAVTL